MSCPQCKKPIEADHVYEIADEIEKLTIMRSELQVQAMKIVRKEGLEQDERINTPGDYFYDRVMLWAETKICFYECAECSKPYYGGLIDCE